jgi:hypothetical protein
MSDEMRPNPVPRFIHDDVLRELAEAIDLATVRLTAIANLHSECDKLRAERDEARVCLREAIDELVRLRDLDGDEQSYDACGLLIDRLSGVAGLEEK